MRDPRSSVKNVTFFCVTFYAKMTMKEINIQQMAERDDILNMRTIQIGIGIH